MSEAKVVKTSSFTKLFDAFTEGVLKLAPAIGKFFVTEYVGVVQTHGKVSLFGHKFPFFSDVSAMKVKLRRKVVKEGDVEKVKIAEAVLQFPALKKAPAIGDVKMAGWGDMYFFYCKDDNMPAGVKFMLFPPDAQLRTWCDKQIEDPDADQDIKTACAVDPKKAYYMTDPEVDGADCTALEYLMIDKLMMEAGGKLPKIRAHGQLNAHGVLVKLFGNFTTNITDEFFQSLQANADKGNEDAKLALQRISEASKDGDITPLLAIIAEMFDGSSKYDM